MLQVDTTDPRDSAASDGTVSVRSVFRNMPDLPVLLFVVILVNGNVFAEDSASSNEELRYGPPRRIATLANESINESSGLAASRVKAGLFWTHNDSGDKPRVFAFDAQGHDRGEFIFSGTKAEDWEDMASVTIDGTSYLVLGDIGDNARRREFCSLYVAEEPMLAQPLRGRPPPQRSLAARQIRFRYADGPRDCESMAIDPIGKHIFLVTKAFSIRCPVYHLDWPARNSDEVLVATRIGSVKLPMVTAMDISSDGRRAVMATYADAFEFQRQGSEPWSATFARTPKTITMPARRQGETICYGQDGQTLYLTSERTPTPLWCVAPLPTP